MSVHFCMDAFEHLVPSAVAGKIVLRLCVADLRRLFATSRLADMQAVELPVWELSGGT